MQEQVNYLPTVAEDSVESRSEFIWKTYAHVVGAILAFAAISVYFFQSGLSERFAVMMVGNWWLVLGAFIIGGWAASHAAHRVASPAGQYAALAFFVFLEAVIFAPMLYFAYRINPAIIDSAAGVTLFGCAALIAVAMITRKDFSFLRGLLVWGGLLALGGIFGSFIFGFESALGTWFSVAMIGLAGASVLYDTSNILHHYPKDRYVAASLELFASIALMFWYVLRLFMSRD